MPTRLRSALAVALCAAVLAGSMVCVQYQRVEFHNRHLVIGLFEDFSRSPAGIYTHPGLTETMQSQVQSPAALLALQQWQDLGQLSAINAVKVMSVAGFPGDTRFDYELHATFENGVGLFRIAVVQHRHNFLINHIHIEPYFNHSRSYKRSI